MYGDEEVGADDIYIETAGEDEEIGAARARPKARAKGGRPAFRRAVGIPMTSIAAGSTVALPVTLNAPFKGIGMRMAGANQNLLFFNGATIRGRPQDGAAGSIGCAIFANDDHFEWEWDTASPGENFTLSFTNTHTAAVVPTGNLIGYLAP